MTIREIKDHFVYTSPQYQPGQQVWQGTRPMIVAGMAWCAGSWGYCLVDPIDEENETIYEDLHGLWRDRQGTWFDEDDISATAPDDSARGDPFLDVGEEES